MTNERGKIPLRNIIKTFACGKPERMIHKCLTDLGLSGDKVRMLSAANIVVLIVVECGAYVRVFFLFFSFARNLHKK